MELIEYVPGLLYFLSSHAVPAATTSSQEDQHANQREIPFRTEYIHVEKVFPYANFYLDFGPLHLSQIFAFERLFNEKLRAIGNRSGDGEEASDERDDPDDNNNNQQDASDSALDCRVCVYASLVPQHRANAVCLLGCWAILFKKWSADRAFAPFKHLLLPSFHDASPYVDRFGLGVLHVFQGLERAIGTGVFPRHVEDFDEAAFLEDMDPDVRDLTWITPQIAAFAGPQSQPNWFGRSRPQEYVAYLRSHGVGRVVRLNSSKYDKKVFIRAGIEVVDLYFPDGTCPSESIVRQFLALCDVKIAVHCKAGLGRTGTLIACHLMHQFHFTAEEAIGWLRLSRPGSVIGAQQHFLRELEPRIFQLAIGSDQKMLQSVSNTDPIEFEHGDGSTDEDHEQNFELPVSSTKGIAARPKAQTLSPVSTMVSSALLQSKASSPLPPKIPGWCVTRLPATSSSVPPHATQGDLLLLRKHAQQLPLGTSFWPPSPAPQPET